MSKIGFPICFNSNFLQKYVIIKSMDYQDYIWDLGGTLLNNYETSTAAFVETLAGFGIQAN